MKKGRNWLQDAGKLELPPPYFTFRVFHLKLEFTKKSYFHPPYLYQNVILVVVLLRNASFFKNSFPWSYLLVATVFAATAFLLNLQGCGSREGYWNHAPEVSYTGMASCQPCHQDIYESYRRTGMGQSWYRPHPADTIEAFGPQVVVHDEPSGYSYHPYWAGNSFYILEFRLENGDTTYRRLEKMDWVVGSGNQTRSYILERNGYLYEAPITWYVTRQMWDLSPGYHNGNNSRFSRPIGQECMACHNGYSQHTSGTVNHFTSVATGIGCERCHGPGQAHIERMQAGDEVDVGREIDYSIVNPENLSVDLQIDVCQQCHLQGINVPKETTMEFRAGMALADFREIFLEKWENDAAFGIASHAERLRQSECFVQSEGKLTCTTCHDPHVSVHEKPGDSYNTTCEGCHTPQATTCSAPVSQREARNDNCWGCHMPKGGTSDIPHVSFSDHYIRVVRDSAAYRAPTHSPEEIEAMRELIALECATSDAPARSTVGKAWLRYFEGHDADPQHLQRAENFLSDEDPFSQAKLHYFRGAVREAWPSVQAAAAERSSDDWVLYWKGEIASALKKWHEAEAAYRSVWERNPWFTDAGIQLAGTYLSAHPGDRKALADAREVLQEVLARKPHDKRALANLGFVLMNQGEYAPAKNALDQALQYDPFYALAMENQVYLAVLTRDEATAKRWLERLRKAEPDYPKLPQLEEAIARGV